MSEVFLPGTKVRVRCAIHAAPTEPDTRIPTFLRVPEGTLGTVESDSTDEEGLLVVAVPFGDHPSPAKVEIYDSHLEAVKE